jgi:hypothetical protein
MEKTLNSLSGFDYSQPSYSCLALFTPRACCAASLMARCATPDVGHRILFVADTLEIDEQAMLQIEQDKILAVVKLPRVFFHPMRAGITDPPQFEDSDHADECASVFDRSPFARRLNRRKKRRKMSSKTTVQ